MLVFLGLRVSRLEWQVVCGPLTTASYKTFLQAIFIYFVPLTRTPRTHAEKEGDGWHCEATLWGIRKGRRCVLSRARAVAGCSRYSQQQQVVVSVMVPSPRWAVAVGCVSRADEASYRAAWDGLAARNGEARKPTIHRSGERSWSPTSRVCCRLKRGLRQLQSSETGEFRMDKARRALWEGHQESSPLPPLTATSTTRCSEEQRGTAHRISGLHTADVFPRLVIPHRLVGIWCTIEPNLHWLRAGFRILETPGLVWRQVRYLGLVKLNIGARLSRRTEQVNQISESHCLLVSRK